MSQEPKLLLKNYSPLKDTFQLILKEFDNENSSADYFLQILEKYSNKPIITLLEIYPTTEISHQIALRKAGYEVTSVALEFDISAVGGERDGDHYIIGKDFNLPNFKNKFDAVIITQGCFGKFISDEQTQTFLQKLNSFLTSNAIVLFEIWHLPGINKSVTDEKGHKEWEKINSAHEGSIIRLTSSKLQLKSSTLSVDIHYIIENNNEVKRFNESYLWRLYTISELDLLLSNTGLHLLNTFKFLTFEDPEFSSFRLLAIAQK